MDCTGYERLVMKQQEKRDANNFKERGMALANIDLKMY